MVPLFLYYFANMELLKSHRTVRKYSQAAISEELLNDILESGLRASNTGNMQLYSVVVTRDLEMKNKLSPFHFNQKMVKEASVVLTICLDFNRFSHWCHLNGTYTDLSSVLWLLNGVIDASLLAQNICIAAESEGIGICYLGTTLYNPKEISEVLGLPIGVIPVTTLTLGYPDETPEKADRLALCAVVHQEKYSAKTDSEIEEIYEEKESLVSSKRFVIENSKENLAQVYAEVRYKSSDSDFFSSKLVDFLREQGFCL
jgi:Nitroreductase